MPYALFKATYAMAYRVQTEYSGCIIPEEPTLVTSRLRSRDPPALRADGEGELHSAEQMKLAGGEQPAHVVLSSRARGELLCLYAHSNGLE